MTASLTFNFAGGSASVPLAEPAVRALEAEVQRLVEKLRITTAAGRKQPQPATEYRHRAEGIDLEVFCNPNLWPSPFAARVLVTIKTAQLRLSVEVELSQLREDIHQYLQVA